MRRRVSAESDESPQEASIGLSMFGHRDPQRRHLDDVCGRANAIHPRTIAQARDLSDRTPLEPRQAIDDGVDVRNPALRPIDRVHEWTADPFQQDRPRLRVIVCSGRKDRWEQRGIEDQPGGTPATSRA